VRIIILTSMLRGEYMTHSSPIYDFGTNRNGAPAVGRRIGSKGGPLPPDTLQKIALIQSALTAVREELRTTRSKSAAAASCLLNKFHSHSRPSPWRNERKKAGQLR